MSDGDSSAYNALCNMNNGEGPCGVKIEKAECINLEPEPRNNA